MIEQQVTRISDQLFGKLEVAVAHGKPAVRLLLMAHRGQPYFDDLLDKARVMLRLDDFYEGS